MSTKPLIVVHKIIFFQSLQSYVSTHHVPSVSSSAKPLFPSSICDLEPLDLPLFLFPALGEADPVLAVVPQPHVGVVVAAAQGGRGEAVAGEREEEEQGSVSQKHVLKELVQKSRLICKRKCFAIPS